MLQRDNPVELMLPPGPRVESEKVDKFIAEQRLDQTEPLLILAAAYRYYRDGEFSRSRRLLRELTKLQPDDLVGQLLLGCVYVRQGQSARAQIKFLRVLKRDPQNAVALFNLAQLAERRGELQRAAELFREYLISRPTDTRVMTHLAELLIMTGEITEAARLYEQAAHGDPPSERAINELGYQTFRRGLDTFNSGELFSALKIWGESFAAYSGAYYRDARLVSVRRELVKQLRDAATLDKRVAEYIAGVQSGKTDDRVSYEIAALGFLVHGVFPESFIAFEKLEMERTRVRGLLSQEGEYAYVHYRLATIAAYKGEYGAAALEMRLAKDLLKGKKEDVWRVSELYDFFSSLSRRLETSEQYNSVRFGDEKWVDAGFRTRFESESWKRMGFAPEKAKRWRSLGFSAEMAAPWQREEVEPESATDWRAAGFVTPREAKRWSRGGVSPLEARRWRDEFADDVSRAIQCLRVGITDPAEAKQWLRVFELPWEAGRWKSAGFSPAEALKHRADGITDPDLVKKSS